MLYVKDVAGNEFPLQATITNELELNGNHTVSCRILPTKTNAAFIEDISQMWTLIDHEGIEHKIVYLRKKGEGTERMSVEIKALPLFFDEFDTTRIYEEYNEHMTAVEFFDLVFGGSSYTYALIDSFSAIQWEGVGKGETRLEMFKRGLERYGAEFRIVGNTVYLKALIGRDTSFMYRYRLNASNITQENDATAMYTYARGFGDFAEGEESSAKLKRSYTSPLASIIGLRHAPPVYDGRVTQAATMDAMLKTLVDESLIVSVSADIHDLRKQGYALAQPELGDRVFLIDERIGLDSEVRVNKMTITKDWRGNVVDFSVVFGSPDVVSRYTSNLNGAAQAINDLLEGRRKLPFSAYDVAVQEATKALKAAQTELSFSENGILAVDKNNPNYVTLFNSAGLGVSDDGGNVFKSAITGQGVEAEVLVGKILIGQTLLIQNTSSTFLVDGSGVTLDGGALTIKGKLPDSQLASASTWNNKMTKITSAGVYTGEVTAEQITTGTLDAGKVRVRGGTSTEYTLIDGSYLESRGKYNRTWMGSTSNNDVKLRFQNGYMRARNDNKNWSLYFSDFGISTYADGEGDADASGTIEFHSSRFSPSNSTSGLTLYSLAGRIGLETDGSRIYLYSKGASVRVADPNDSTYYPIAASSFDVTSSVEFKKNIENYEANATELIKSTPVRSYHFNDDVDDIDPKRIGLILQESPLEVVNISDGGQTLNIYAMASLLWKSVQELSQRLEALEIEPTEPEPTTETV